MPNPFHTIHESEFGEFQRKYLEGKSETFKEVFKLV